MDTKYAGRSWGERYLERKKTMEKMFKLVFEGKVSADKPLEDVKKDLAAMLKRTPADIEQMFANAPMVIKSSVDAATAAKFEAAFKRAGTECAAIELKRHTDLPSGGVILTNVETVPGATIVEHFGLVSGSTIRAKHVGRDIMASLKNLVGGELKGYTQLLQESRQEATDRMISQARQLGANAIVNIRYSTSSVAQGAAELYAYGTAVRVE